MMRRDIATVYEMDALKRMRETPRLDLVMPVPRFAQNHVNYEMQRWRERRINYLDARLRVSSHVMRREFDRER